MPPRMLPDYRWNVADLAKENQVLGYPFIKFEVFLKLLKEWASTGFPP